MKRIIVGSGYFALAAAGLSRPAWADIPPPEQEIATSGVTWLVIAVLVAAVVGVLVYRRRR